MNATKWNFVVAQVFVTVFVSIVIAEFAGYWIHRLLHSDKLPFLSRGHLIHHFLIYGPRQPMQSKGGYRDATDSRFSVGNIGLEWLGPSAIILAFCWMLMIVYHVPRAYQMISVCSLLAWPIFTFSYLHDRMHEADYWMTRIPLLNTWFLKARRLHEIHHYRMDVEGRMDSNFGIGFYFFDRFFGTISHRHLPFNWTGYEIAKHRYLLEESDEDSDEDFDEVTDEDVEEDSDEDSPW